MLIDTSLFIARLDKFNNILFSKRLTGIKGSSRKILQRYNGDILLGVIETDQSLVPVFYVFRFTINGDLVWQKRLEITNVPSLNNNVSFEITEAPDNNLYIGLTEDIETDPLNSTNRKEHLHFQEIYLSSDGRIKRRLILYIPIFNQILHTLMISRQPPDFCHFHNRCPCNGDWIGQTVQVIKLEQRHI